VETPAELMTLYQLSENLYRLRVRRGSDLVGQSMQSSRLRQNFSLTVLEILRPSKPDKFSHKDDENPVLESDGYTSIKPNANTTFMSMDILIAQVTPDEVTHVAAYWNLGVQPAHADDESSLLSDEVGIAEILLPPRSSLVGKTLVKARFGTLYQLTVLGINRPGIENLLNLKETVLRFGDTLLVQGPWKKILELRKKRQDFVVMGQPEQMILSPARSKAPLAMLIMLGMLVLMITNIIPLVTASMLAALMMIITGCVSIDEAYEAVDWKSIVLIAGMLPMSIALEKVGLVSLVAEGLTDSLGSMSPLMVLGGLFLLTSLFTQVLSNTATTVLIAPIGLVTAQNLGIQPYSFMMGIAIAASMAFASPVASPVNTLVMGAGHYRFSDYIKVGIPMILVMLLISLLVLPLLWPF
jgi:di/tricarboxylate transporter